MSVSEKDIKKIIFSNARTYNDWQRKGVSNKILNELYDLMKFGPTSANCSPSRIIFIKSPEAKERLKPFIIESNLEKTMTAPVTAIIAFDIDFHKHLPKLFPHDLDAQNWFNYSQEVAYTNAFRNSSIQGGYFIIAARMLGLDCGPMSGFDQNGLDKEFFPNSSIKSNFLCNIGYGDPTNIFKRSPRFEFDEVCEIL
ncbi:MAG: malonic semialdehyde reductase [Candidatus Marinimicrobia bacterium TMED108]|nr:MAG: malonic semialdehyde reductase [Candidatus Marinimicrobia bacterium TMED108]